MDSLGATLANTRIKSSKDKFNRRYLNWLQVTLLKQELKDVSNALERTLNDYGKVKG